MDNKNYDEFFEQNQELASLEPYEPTQKDLAAYRIMKEYPDEDIDAPRLRDYLNIAQVYRNGQLVATVTDDRAIYYIPGKLGEVSMQKSCKRGGFGRGIHGTLLYLLDLMFLSAADKAPRDVETL